jgi:CBS domain-containing protein
MRHTRIDPREGPGDRVPPSIDIVCVRDCMSRPAVTIAPATPLADAVRVMAGCGIHYLPVVDEDRLVGIVNADDVTRSRRDEPLPATVAAVMRSPVIVVAPSVLLTDASRLMAQQGVGALPVVEEGRVIGMLTQSDVVAAFARGECA